MDYYDDYYYDEPQSYKRQGYGGKKNIIKSFKKALEVKKTWGDDVSGAESQSRSDSGGTPCHCGHMV